MSRVQVITILIMALLLGSCGSNGTKDPGPSICIYFCNLDELSDLVEAANASPDQFEAYIKSYENHTHVMWFDQLHAKKAVENLFKAPIPILKNGQSDSDFIAEYNVDQNYLDVVYYQINQTKYRFCFEYNVNDEPNQRYGCGRSELFDKKPNIAAVPIYSTTMDMYKDNDAYYGSIVVNGVEIIARIYTTDASKVSFEMFDFVSIEELIK